MFTAMMGDQWPPLPSAAAVLSPTFCLAYKDDLFQLFNQPINSSVCSQYYLNFSRRKLYWPVYKMPFCFRYISRVESCKPTFTQCWQNFINVFFFSNKRIETRLGLFFGTERIRERDEWFLQGVKTDIELKFHSHIKSFHCKIWKKNYQIFFQAQLKFSSP